MINTSNLFIYLHYLICDNTKLFYSEAILGCTGQIKNSNTGWTGLSDSPVNFTFVNCCTKKTKLRLAATFALTSLTLSKYFITITAIKKRKNGTYGVADAKSYRPIHALGMMGPEMVMLCHWSIENKTPTCC